MSVFKNFLLIVIVSALIAACQPIKPVSSPVPSPENNGSVVLPIVGGSSSSTAYPAPVMPGDQSGSGVYPAPSGEGGTPVATVNPYPLPGANPATTANPYPMPGQAVGIPLSGYEPSPEDSSLQRAEAFVEVADSKIMSMESNPLQVKLVLKGNLPTACNLLRVVVTSPDAEKRIQVGVYTVVDPNKVCAQMLQPFEATIPLGSYTSGKYSVYVNGELLGEFGS